jgi:hypothetical protein
MPVLWSPPYIRIKETLEDVFRNEINIWNTFVEHLDSTGLTKSICLADNFVFYVCKYYIHIVTCIPIAKQRFCKHIPATKALNNRTSTACNGLINTHSWKL